MYTIQIPTVVCKKVVVKPVRWVAITCNHFSGQFSTFRLIESCFFNLIKGSPNKNKGARRWGVVSSPVNKCPFSWTISSGDYFSQLGPVL